MNKYNAGKIYRIDVDGCEKVYIGSCYTSLDTRFSKHKHDESSSTELFKYGVCPIITLIENYSCETKIDLRMREQYYMDKFVSEGYTLINKQRAYMSPEMYKEYKKEYYETNKEHIKEQKKEYYETNKEVIKEYRENNKEHIKEQKKEHYENNKEAIKEQHKERYQQNKEHIIEHNKEYNEIHKDKIKEQKNKKLTCECGGRYTHSNKSIHSKTKKHIAFSSLMTY